MPCIRQFRGHPLETAPEDVPGEALARRFEELVDVEAGRD